MKEELVRFLNRKVAEYNRPAFIAADPISVPHRFTKKQDIEIAAFFAAVFAWGNRTTIINKTTELLRLMDNVPHEFCLHPSPTGLRRLEAFKHRTFNPTDLLYFVEFFHQHYSQHASLESAFTASLQPTDNTIENALIGFHDRFFMLEDAPQRTRKHVPTPARGSTCKRLCMFLRWMVRQDDNGVDFGLWKGISPAQLVCPVDVHVARVARGFGLISRPQTDWPTALELTEALRLLDPQDPCKYDFALFSLGAEEKF